nr:MAG TPA: helix-turn-helix domain protein [Caudoviricetes sp.]
MKMLRVKALRKEARMSQAELAEKLHITQTSVSQWETGKSEPSIDVLTQMSEIFNVPVGYILGREDLNGERNLQKEKAPAEADAEDLGKLTFLERLALTCFRHLPEEDRAEILKEMIERGSNIEKDDGK